MFDDVLIESGGRDKHKGTWFTALVSAIIHIAIIGAIVAAGLYVKKNPEIVEKPIHAFMVSAPPPPPPPPPPPAASHATPTPVHTEVARRARIEGIVIIEAVIDRDGNVTEARVLKPLALGLSDAALDAVRKWKFKPGTMNGQPVAVYYNLTVTFRVE